MLTNIVLHFISTSFYLSVKLINFFFETKESSTTIESLIQLPEGSLGKAIGICLQNNNLKLVPYFESHDLKHVLFDYKMTALDEIRLQACMLGNGNWSIPSILIFLFGAILLPSKWSLFYLDFKKGLQAAPIKTWTIHEYSSQDLMRLRRQILEQNSLNSKYKLFVIKLYRIASLGLILAGTGGMLYCLPYLYSANIEDLIGAGFPFLAGSIMVVGGFINLSLNSRRAMSPT